MSTTSARLLSNIELCERRGYYARDWRAPKLSDIEFLQSALKVGVTTSDPSFGECAGEEIMDLGVKPGLDCRTNNVYDSVVHLAYLADILANALRRPQEAPWEIPDTLDTWTPSCFMVGSQLRRVALISHYNDERHFSELRSWYTLGEMAQYEMPMQIAFLVIGQLRDGRRVGPWTKGFRHPANKVLRFRKKNGSTHSTFKDTWTQVWREQTDDLTAQQWLQAMLEDDILRDVAFSVEVPLPEKKELQRIKDLAARKMERLMRMSAAPEEVLSVCEWPNPCPFKVCCHSRPQKSPQKAGFVALRDFADPQ